jgi:hypothetical protein
MPHPVCISVLILIFPPLPNWNVWPTVIILFFTVALVSRTVPVTLILYRRRRKTKTKTKQLLNESAWNTLLPALGGLLQTQNSLKLSYEYQEKILVSIFSIRLKF